MFPGPRRRGSFAPTHSLKVFLSRQNPSHFHTTWRIFTAFEHETIPRYSCRCMSFARYEVNRPPCCVLSRYTDRRINQEIHNKNNKAESPPCMSSFKAFHAGHSSILLRPLQKRRTLLPFILSCIHRKLPIYLRKRETVRKADRQRQTNRQTDRRRNKQ